MFRRLTSTAVLCSMLLAPFGSLTEQSVFAAPTDDPILRWNAIALQAVADDHSGTYGAPQQMGPGRASRALAIIHAAMYDALNSIEPTHEPYLTFLPVPEGQEASVDAAVAAAAHITLVALYPAQQSVFDAAFTAHLAEIPNGPEKTLGTGIGEYVAEQLLEARSADNSAIVESYTPSDQPGHHRKDPLNPGQPSALNPQWGLVTPFSMDSGDQFRAPPPPALDSAEYATAFNEVKDYGGDGVTTPTIRTADQTEIGIYWGYDGVKHLGPPPRLYNQIARVIAEDHGNTPAENARLFALMNIAQADAGIASWESKYVYDYWRPILAVREADLGTGPSGLGDNNPLTTGDVNWTPLGAPASNQSNGGVNFTPPFPAYPSGHATFGAAAFHAIAKFYGTDNVPFTFTSDELNGVTTDNLGNVRPLSPRHYDNLIDAIEDNGQSRIYLGIHWSFDKTAGIAMGNAIADHMFDTIMQERDDDDAGDLDDPVLRWNAIAIQADADTHSGTFGPPEQMGPGRASRALAIVHAAIYDAVNSIDGTHEPYLTFVPHSGDVDPSVDAAVAQAAWVTLSALYPSQHTVFDAALAEHLALIPEGAGKDYGIGIGQFVGDQILAARSADGSGAPDVYTPSDQPGKHRKDPLNPGQPYLGPAWGQVTPFIMASGDQFQTPTPPAIDSPEYATAFNEVKDFGGDGVVTPTVRTQDQTEIGLYWGYDGTKKLGTPPRLYNQITRQIAEQQGNSVVENARLFALVNMAQADAGIGSWESKYEFNYWRPVVAVREADLGTGPSGLGDNNPLTTGDVNWTPLGAPASNQSNGGVNFTPPFPAYPSGHATFGSATFRTIADFYGTDNIPFSFISDELNGVTTDNLGNVRPLSPRSFSTLSQATEENGQSRIYLGIHWAFDKTAGIAMGNAIADYNIAHALRPVDSLPDPTPELPELDAEIEGPTTVNQGDLLVVTLSTENSGEATANGVHLQLQTQLGSVTVAGGTSPDCVTFGGNVSCGAFNLFAGASAQRTVVLATQGLSCADLSFSAVSSLVGEEYVPNNNESNPLSISVVCSQGGGSAPQTNFFAPSPEKERELRNAEESASHRGTGTAEAHAAMMFLLNGLDPRSQRLAGHYSMRRPAEEIVPELVASTEEIESGMSSLDHEIICSMRTFLHNPARMERSKQLGFWMSAELSTMLEVDREVVEDALMYDPAMCGIVTGTGAVQGI